MWYDEYSKCIVQRTLISWADLVTKWGLADKVPLTDPETANNSNIADAISTFQQAAQVITDELAKNSSLFEQQKTLLTAYQDAVVLAYVAALDGNLPEVIKQLKKVVNT